MKISLLTQVLVAALTSFPLAAPGGRIITVNTTNLVAAAGETNFFTAITLLQDGDSIHFNIPGPGPHYLPTPAGGYHLIFKNNVTIGGYTQPGAVPNSNPILAPNNAKIKIVLDSRNGNYTDMGYEPENPRAGYEPGEGAILGIFRATNVTIRGLCFLGTSPGVVNNNSIAVARDYSGGAPGLGDGLHVSGCWIGLDVDGTPGFGTGNGISAFRHRDDAIGPASRLPSNGHIIGVKPGSANPRAEFNVIVGSTINIIMEGQRHRISGNFLGVLPNGTNDYILPFAEPGRFAESHIEIGRGGSDMVIGTDGDGVNDADERNIMGGVVTGGRFGSFNLGGYRHVLEIYSLSDSPGPDRQNIKIAGNYFGVGIDGSTRFTNGVPAMNGSATTGTQYWIGTDLDGVSDNIEPNIIFNNFPAGLFYESPYTNSTSSGAGSHGFFDEPSNGAFYSVRGNVMVNNYPYPVNPGRDGGGFLTAYIAKGVVTTDGGLGPLLSTDSSTVRLIGTIPEANADFPWTILDLYLPDPEGLINGLVAPDPDLTNGWVQGLKYLGSFLDNGPQDLNTNAGAYEFDIAALGLSAGTMVTVSGNYSKDPPGTHNGRTLTSLFSPPVELAQPAAVPFTPGGIATVGLTHLVQDRILFDTETPNLNNWEPFISVLGNSTFLIEANTFADDGTFSNQRFALAFQPAAGGAHSTGEVFYADNGTPFRGQINGSRQNGNPGRVAGDKRPGAVNFIAGAEASPFNFPPFQSDNRWSTYASRYIAADGQIGRFGSVQTYSLNLTTLNQTPLMKAFDVISGRVTSADPPANMPEVSRFGGELAALDNGNFVVVVDDRSGYHDPARAAVAIIIGPDGSIVKDTFVVEAGEIWSNVAAHKGGFCVRRGPNFFFYDNNGNLTGQAAVADSGIGFDAGRGDGTRIASHINSPYVFLAGRADDAGVRAVRVAVWDSRDRSFVTVTNVSELTPAFGGSDAADFQPDYDENGTIDFDRVNLAVDALNRIAVAYEALVPGFDVAPGGNPLQTLVRVLSFDETTKKFGKLTASFFPFVNNGSGFRTFRPSVAMTTRQICIAAKGEINRTNNLAAGADTANQTTFYTVISHPDPKADPTVPVGGVAPPDLQVYGDPPSGWTYSFNGSSDNAGAAGSGFTSLDGAWSHDNGSDEWDGSRLGEPFGSTNRPGGVSSIEGYLRIQDTGDPRDFAFPDPSSNRKVYLGRNITTEGASGTILNSGVTLHFRARIPTTGLLDKLHPDGNPGGAGPQPYPATGDGYLIHDGGKGNIGIKQANGGVISFSLATAGDTGSAAGLVMNNLNGTAVSGTVDSGEAGTANRLDLDPTAWHEFWISIQADTSGGGTHRVDIYTDGSLKPQSFFVTAGSGSDFDGISYIAMGVGSTGQSGALDVDYFRYRIGAVAPSSSSLLTITSVSSTATDVSLTWSGGTGPFLLQKKFTVSDATWVNLLTTTNRSATTIKDGNAGFFRVVDLATNPTITFTVWMSGAAERPNPVTTSASGSGIITLTGDTLAYNINYANLSGTAIAAHIHAPATSSQAASPIFPLTPVGAFGSSGALSGSVTLTASQKTAILGGTSYANIHTVANGGGEIRGQVIPTQFVVSLSGEAERLSPVSATASGFGMLSLNGNQLIYNISYSGLSGAATAAHIHGRATIAQAAGVLFPLTPAGAFGVSGSLTGSMTLNEAQLAMFADGEVYANIHTPNNPGGEIRGQISPLLTAIPFTAWLNGPAERPAVITSASGSGMLLLDGNTLLYRISYANLSGPAIAAHIHGPTNTSGSIGVLQPFRGAAGTSGTLSGSLTLSDTQKGYLLSGLTYANIHTGNNPGGEIRGQIGQAQLKATLTGEAERPPVTTTGNGLGSFTRVGNLFTYLVNYAGLSVTATAAHIHGVATPEQSAGVLFPFTAVGVFGASGVLAGTHTLTDAELAAIVDGLTYANIHTSTNPGGEIRGQVTP